MGTPKNATVLRVSQVAGTHTQIVRFRAENPLGFRGGQYIIIDSGETLPTGKAAKRAYSFISPDSEQGEFELVALPIPHGRCSRFLNHLKPGDTMRFSGPWGKFRVESPTGERTLVLATDTGITAALGLLQSEAFAGDLPQTTLLWTRGATDYFLPEDVALSRVPKDCARIETLVCPPVGDDSRVASIVATARAFVVEHQIQRVFACGDGAVNYALGDALDQLGIAVERDQLESFFNMPKKST